MTTSSTGSPASAGRRFRGVLAQPQHVRKRRDVVVPGRRKVGEFGHRRVGRAGHAKGTADHQRQRGSERVVVQAATVSRAGREARRLAGPVPELVGQECSNKRRSVLVGAGGSTQFCHTNGSTPHHLGVRGDVAGRRTGVECLGVRTWLGEEERPQQRMGGPADLSPGSVPVQADPGPNGDVGAAERDVRDLKGDGGDVPASQQVAPRPSEQLGTVLVVGQAVIEREQRDGVAPKRVPRQAEPP